MKKQSYKEGDKVFAKVKGYPAWPAVVVAKSGKKFSVRFYGTNEIGYIKPEDIFFYTKYKEQLSKGSKKKEFKDALEQIELEVNANGTDGAINAETSQGEKRKRSPSETSNEPESLKKAIKNEPTLKIKPENFEHKPNEDIPKVDSIEKPDFYIITENDLKDWKHYADLVNEKPDLYKTMPAYTETTLDLVFPIESSNGGVLGVKIEKFHNLTNEYDSALHYSKEVDRVLHLKSTINVAESNSVHFCPTFQLTRQEVDDKLKQQGEKIESVYSERMKTEYKMIQLRVEVTNCMGLKEAKPLEAIRLLDELIQLDFDQLMIKKHPETVDVIKKLRKYVGNAKEWNLSEEDLENFNKEAKSVREKADEVYAKIQDLFFKFQKEAGTFSTHFQQIVDKFNEDCAELSQREIYILIDEPYSRQSVLRRLRYPMEEGPNKENQISN